MEPENHSITQMETLRLECWGNKSFSIHQGQGETPGLLSPQPEPLPPLWRAVRLRVSLIPGRVYLRSTLSFQGAQPPPRTHPLWCLTPPGAADGARPAEKCLTWSPAVAQM